MCFICSNTPNVDSKDPDIVYIPSLGILVEPYIEGCELWSARGKFLPLYEIKVYCSSQPPGGGPQARGNQSIKRFFFHNIYPNPTKGYFNIKFNSPDERRVSIKMYDVSGRLVQNLFNDRAKIGMNEFLLTSKDLSSGIYFVKIETKAYSKTERVIFLR